MEDSTNLTVAVFSNCTDTCLKDPTIYDTVMSLGVTFHDSNAIDSMTVYVDPNPNPKLYRKYAGRLRELGFYVVKTKGLADGWKKALDSAKTDYIFMLEHDWVFDKDVVQHTLKDILYRMKRDRLWCMLFNKHPNDISLNNTKWQSYFEPTKSFYCLTDRFSNNPHILDVKRFKEEQMHKIDWTAPGAGQIEQVLQRKVDIAVYGRYGDQPAIIHIDGRKGGKK